MRRACRTSVATFALLFSILASAAEVRLLTVGSTLASARTIAENFTRETGHTVTITMRPPFNIDKELAEKPYDVIIISIPAMEIHDKAGNIAPGTRHALARVGAAVVVKEGAPVPDVSTPEKLKAAALAAKSITHTDPVTPNTSGAVAGAAFTKLGILDQLKSKTRYAPLAVGGKLVVDGEIEMGIFNISEVPKGAVAAGPLPGELQSYTVYESAVLNKGSRDEAANAYAKYLGSPDVAAIWESWKLEPASRYLPAGTTR